MLKMVNSPTTQNCSFSDIADAVFNYNPEISSCLTRMQQGISGQVYKAEIGEEIYIVKVSEWDSKEKYEQEQRILDEIKTPNSSVDYSVTPEILYFESEPRQIGYREVGVEIQTYLTGEPKVETTPEDVISIVKMMYGLHLRLSQIPVEYENQEESTLASAFEEVRTKTDDEFILGALDRLLANSKYNELLEEPHILVDYDCNIFNLLFEGEGKEQKVKKVDISLIYAPAIYQAGSLFLCLLHNFAPNLNPDSLEKVGVTVSELWKDISNGEQIYEPGDLIIMMQPFAIMVAAHFDDRIKNELGKDIEEDRWILDYFTSVIEFLQSDM